MEAPPAFRTLAALARQFAAPLSLALALAHASAVRADVTIYGDSIAAGWSDWSWGSTRNPANASPVHGGTKSLAVTITAAWSALYLHADAPVAVNTTDQLSFWIHGGTGGQRLQVVANGGAGHAVTAPANAWAQVTVPLSALGSFTALTDLYWQDATGGPLPTFYLDDIVLLAGTPPPPQPGPAIAIDAGAGRRAISEDIYGMNFADEALARELRVPVRRRGGNSTTRYNWQVDAYNTGSDWYFENIPEDNPNPAQLPNGSAADRFVEQDRRTGTRTILTVPTIGWVAKRRLASHPYDCGFKVSKYGAQQSVDPYDTDCGNGLNGSGGNLAGNNPADTSVAVGPDFASGWIAHLVGRFGAASAGGVTYYSLDNEPFLWNSTHRDVHPQPPSYDEIRDRGIQYGAAIKAADPTAKTLGPVEWGWCGYFYSAVDGCGPGADYHAHGDTPFAAWYLQQMRAYEQQHGVRVLDYLDLHYYPAANGVALSTAGSLATQALRLRSTRSLWDPAYIDESWISDTAPGGVAVRMIPRMRAWVDANYPGTRLAITEYNWGGLESLNGALAQADVLGIFGREGLDLATIWGPPTAGQPGAHAFRMYRNYDGAGHGFGETSVRTTSTDQARLSAYAAQRTADGALTLMVINKTANDLTSPVSLAGFAARGIAAVYRYSGASPGAIVRVADQPVGKSGFSASFPANSITLLVMPGTIAPPSRLVVPPN